MFTIVHTDRGRPTLRWRAISKWVGSHLNKLTKNAKLPMNAKSIYMNAKLTKTKHEYKHEYNVVQMYNVE